MMKARTKQLLKQEACRFEIFGEMSRRLGQLGYLKLSIFV